MFALKNTSNKKIKVIAEIENEGKLSLSIDIEEENNDRLFLTLK